ATRCRLPSGVGNERVQGCREQLVFVVAEHEQSVLDDRTTTPNAGVLEGERSWVDGQTRGVRSNPSVVAPPLIHRGRQLIRSTSGRRVAGGADKVALPDVVRCDAALHLLDRLQGDRRDQRSTASLSLSQAERAVEVGAVHCHVVYPAILAGE